MKRILLACFLMISIYSAVQAQHKIFNQALADSLAKWKVIDQTAAGPVQGKFKELSKSQLDDYRDSVFSTHLRLLNDIFNQYGYPGYDLVGEQGSNNFWLMVQHCDKDVAFQEKVLLAMKKELDRHNADPKNFAYLTDRVKINTGQKQVYGTQVTYNTDSCEAIPKALNDSLNVNNRRKAIGLEAIEAYLNMMSQMHFEMNQAVYEKKGIHQAKLIPEPREAN